MKKRKHQSLLLHKKAISNLDSFLLGGRNQTTDSSPTSDPQTPTALTACQKDCPSDTHSPVTNKQC